MLANTGIGDDGLDAAPASGRFLWLAIVLSSGLATHTFCVAKANEDVNPSGADLPSGRIEIYITPFYNSDGPIVRVGSYSDKLQNADSDSIGALIDEFKENWSTLTAEAMYVLAIRLYDLGRKDESVYWFYHAQFRARLFRSCIDPDKIGGIGAPGFERAQACVAFHQLAGQWINGYAFGDLDKIKATIGRVRDACKQMPELEAAYPRVSFLGSQAWPIKHAEVDAGLGALVEHIDENADEIRRLRTENGIDGKY